MPNILIRRSQILLAHGEFLGDVLIKQGKIAAIAPQIELNEAEQIIEAEGLTLLAGVIDPQVHFREPGLEHK
jgi:dihydroorotase